MHASQQRDSTEWAKVFSDWRRSGESQRGYCLRKGIPISTFTHWRRKMSKSVEADSLVKVDVHQLSSNLGTTGLKIRVGKIEVELSGLESEEVLVRMFRALKVVS